MSGSRLRAIIAAQIIACLGDNGRPIDKGSATSIYERMKHKLHSFIVSI
jgi:predicted ATPase